MAEANVTEGFKITTDVKTLGAFLVIASMGIFGWYDLNSDIEDAKGLPESPVTRVEYDLKDRLVRQSVSDLKDDVDELKEEIKTLQELVRDLQ